MDGNKRRIVQSSSPTPNAPIPQTRPRLTPTSSSRVNVNKPRSALSISTPSSSSSTTVKARVKVAASSIVSSTPPSPWYPESGSDIGRYARSPSPANSAAGSSVSAYGAPKSRSTVAISETPATIRPRAVHGIKSYSPATPGSVPSTSKQSPYMSSAVEPSNPPRLNPLIRARTTPNSVISSDPTSFSALLHAQSSPSPSNPHEPSYRHPSVAPSSSLSSSVSKPASFTPDPPPISIACTISPPPTSSLNQSIPPPPPPLLPAPDDLKLSPLHSSTSIFPSVQTQRALRRSFDTTSTLSSDSPDETSVLGEPSSYSSSSALQPPERTHLPVGLGLGSGGIGSLKDEGSEGEGGEEKEEAKINRKVADLEISNASLLAINHALEATKAKQAKEIRDLRRKLRTGSVQPVSLPLSKRLNLLSSTHPFPPLSDSEDEPGRSSESEDESEDEQFTRIKQVMCDLLEQAVHAVERPVRSTGLGTVDEEGAEKREGGRVLGILEMDEWRARKEVGDEPDGGEDSLDVGEDSVLLDELSREKDGFDIG